MHGSTDDLEAVIYARVSDNRDGRSRSVDQQIKESTRWCERNQVPIHKVIIDDDKGASRYSKKTRTGYQQVLAGELSPSSGKRRILVNWESSRAQRDLSVYIQLRSVCEENGALWCYDGRVYDMTDPEDRRRTAQDAVDDEYEVEKTRKRVLRDMRDNAAAGRPHGKLAYGYKIIRDARTGKPVERVPDEDQAPILREIVRRLLARESARSIAADLNARGVEAARPKRNGEPGRWIPTTLVKIAKSPTYAGLRVHRGEVIGDGTWPPLITPEEHEQLVGLLGSPERRSQRGSEPRWLLTNIARCGVCGAAVKRVNPRGHHMYICGESFCVGREVVRLERLVTQAVIERLESPDVLELLAVNDVQAEAAFEEARRLRKRLEAFVDQATDADEPLSPAALARVEAKLRPQIAAAERRARAAVKSPLVAELAGPHARDKWERLAVSERRQVVAALVDVVIHRARSGTRFNPRYISLYWKGEDRPETTPAEPLPLAEGGNPMDYTANEVSAYIQSVGIEERLRIVEAERIGQRRHKIMRYSIDPKLARVASDG